MPYRRTGTRTTWTRATRRRRRRSRAPARRRRRRRRRRERRRRRRFGRRSFARRSFGRMGNVKIRRGTKAPTAVSRVEVSGRATYRTRATPRTTTPLAAAGEKKGSRRKATPAPVSTATGRRGARGPHGGGGGGATSSRRRYRDPRGCLPSRSKRRRSAPAFLGSCRPCAKPRSSRGGERGARRRRNRAAPCADVWSCSLEIML
mmetsp:Transcript_992/g.3858  ORF Transcript_992/g.3858 Transcript_992/m.3858 type:complete len:204 (+) Transcript_992:332-943(+)